MGLVHVWLTRTMHTNYQLAQVAVCVLWINLTIKDHVQNIVHQTRMKRQQSSESDKQRIGGPVSGSNSVSHAS